MQLHSSYVIDKVIVYERRKISRLVSGAGQDAFQYHLQRRI